MRRLLLLVLPVIAAACDSATAPTVLLSKSEALAALRALQSMSATSQTGALQADAALRAESPPQEQAVEFATECPAGGRYEVVQTSGASEGREILLLDQQERFIGCTVSDSGRTWRFDSDPTLRTKIALTVADRVGAPTTMTTTYAGAFLVATADKSGRCTVDLRFTLDVEAMTGGVEGTLCGQPITAADAVVLPSGFSLRR